MNRNYHNTYSGSRKEYNPRTDALPKQEWRLLFKKGWIAEKIDAEAITFAENFGQHLHSQRFTTNQIRNYFGEVRRIQQKGILKDQTAFLLLKPKLAYAAKRAEKDSWAAKDFKGVMEAAHDAVMEKQGDNNEFENRFRYFVDFLEAILAYHKAAGG